jgi:two-component system, probable response regulator PhcQ
MMRRFLLLDDEINIVHALQRMLRQHIQEKPLVVEIFTDAQQALQRINEVGFDIVIADYQMPSMNGNAFLKAVKQVQPDAVRLMLSASSDFATLMGAVNDAEVFRYIAKPWQARELEEIIQLALIHRDQCLEDRLLADEARFERGELTPQELEATRLEAEEPGITKVQWGPDGSVYLE